MFARHVKQYPSRQVDEIMITVGSRAMEQRKKQIGIKDLQYKKVSTDEIKGHTIQAGPPQKNHMFILLFFFCFLLID